jgi:hypothetical protein
VTTAERLSARWDEEIDLVAMTVELDERTILIAAGGPAVQRRIA